MKSGRDARRQKILEEAWLGDAVLALYCRQLILKEAGVLDAERFIRMTSNHFLAAFGDPAEVEAEIGRIWEDDGLQAAFRHIEERLLPLHRKQEAKRVKGLAPVK